jgi:hypothetical protein
MSGKECDHCTAGYNDGFNVSRHDIHPDYIQGRPIENSCGFPKPLLMLFYIN